MDNEMDINRLKKKLIDYYGTGAFSGMPAMMMEVCNIEKISDDEVIHKAEEVGFNLSEYQ